LVVVTKRKTWAKIHLLYNAIIAILGTNFLVALITWKHIMLQ